mgnify:CR=1 FL=1
MQFAGRSRLCKRKNLVYPGMCWSRLLSLASRHKSFLNLVKHHGSGEVTLQKTAVDEINALVISNKPKKNAISGRMMYQLANTIDSVVKPSNGRSMRGLVMVGDGDSFCAGADFLLAKEVLTTPELGQAMSRFMTDALNTLRDSHIISVCLINGPAVGK